MQQLDFTTFKQTPHDERITLHSLFDMLSDDVVEKFWSYHKENPHVFQLFLKFARQLRESGRKHYSSQAICERIRWHVEVDTRGDEFKMNNNHNACYGRLLVILYPEFDGFFQFRESPGCVRKQ